LTFSLSFAQNWITIPSGTTDQLNDVHFPSENVGFVVGNNYNFLKTIDGGKTWTKSIPAGLVFMGTNNFTKVQFINDSIGFVMLENRGVYKTIDGGLNFTAEMMQGALCFPHDMFFFDEDNGYAAGGQCFAGESVDKKDAGMWGWSTTLNIQAQNMLHTISFRNTNLGLTAGTEGTFFRTTDAGATWDSVFTLSQADSILSISWVNDTLVYATTTNGGNNNTISVSKDAGLTWQSAGNIGGFSNPLMNASNALSNGYVVAGGYSIWTGGNIYEYKPWRTGWSWFTQLTPQTINGVTSYNDSTSFAVGDSGLIMTNKDTSQVSSSIINLSIPSVTVYPNPSNNCVIIPTSESFQFNAIEVYNALGKQIKVKITNSKIDVSNLSNGVYQLLLLQDKKAIATARFVKID